MSDRQLRFSGLNLVAHDLDATIAFYRRLGMSIPDDKVWRTESGPHHVDDVHADSDVGSISTASSLPSHTTRGTTQMHAGMRPCSASPLITRGRRRAPTSNSLLLATRADKSHTTRFGVHGIQWSVDPDGREVGLMSPLNPTRRTPPPSV